jgi:hypothetical protein
MLHIICLASSRLGFFKKKTAATHCKKETGSLQFTVGPQALCILETLSLQMFFWLPLIGEDLVRFKLRRGFT